MGEVGVDVETLGREIFDAERSRHPIEPLTDRWAFDLESAYRIQSVYASLVAASGAKHIGHKIGAANAEIQREFGLNEPDFGRLFDYMNVTAEGLVELDQVIQPLIEPEVAFILGSPLRGPNVSASDVIAATSEVHACFEVVDSRIKDYRVRIEDTIADNGSASRFVLGDQIDDLRELPDLAVEVSRNGTIVGEGIGRAVLGGPAHSVAWLANRLAKVGDTLEPGHIVLSGSLTPAFQVKSGDVFAARFGEEDMVTCRFQ